MLSFRLSRGVRSTISPPIPLAYEWATRYAASHDRPLLDMSQGVPGIPPPDLVQKSLARASSSSSSFGYTRWDGEPSLRSALAEEMRVVYGPKTDVTANDIALTAGCNIAFVAAMMTIADAGDEVILPMPWYFNHEMSLNLLGMKAIPLPTHARSEFQPSIEDCRDRLSAKTKAIVLVTPNNPTGSVYPPSLIASFLSLAREAGVALVVDETYRDFVLSSDLDPVPPHGLFAKDAPNAWRESLIHLYSFSKAYCLPGHRLGAIVASPDFLQDLKTVLDTVQICAPRPVQLALAPLLPDLRGWIVGTSKDVARRHHIFRECLPRTWIIGSQGGYFAFVRHPFRRVKAETVCRRLAEDAGVVSLPASFFSQSNGGGAQDLNWNREEMSEVDEMERWVRFSVANVDDERVRGVCSRLVAFDSSLHWEVETA